MIKDVRLYLLCLYSVTACFLAMSSVAFAAELTGSGHYIADVPTERAEDPQEVVLIEKPASLTGPTLHEVIFNPTLTNEFFYEYQQRFGRTEQEENYYLTNQQHFYRTSSGTITSVTEDQEKRAFGEYMLRRLSEYHVDNYLKTEPSMRRVYEIKQTLSNAKVQVGNYFKCDVSYIYSGNQIKLICDNPFANALINVQMETDKFYPTAPTETTLGLVRPVGMNLFAETHYQFVEGGLKGILTKNINSNFSVNVTGVTYLKEERQATQNNQVSAASVDATHTSYSKAQKENLVLFGAKLIF